MRPLNNADDYHIIALFTTKSGLNQKLIDDISIKWERDVQRIAAQKKITHITDKEEDKNLADMRSFIADMKKVAYLDYLMLNTLAEMFAKVKILSLQVDTQHKQIRELENIITEAKNLATVVYQTYVAKDIRIITE